jgi:hypothetical protein
MTRTRTSSYLGTLTTYSGEYVKGIRDTVRSFNAALKDGGSLMRYRLIVRPRLGRNNPYAYLYARGGALHRYTSQDIKREHGQRFDMYLQRRYDHLD